jgi:hypothetical protein
MIRTASSITMFLLASVLVVACAQLIGIEDPVLAPPDAMLGGGGCDARGLLPCSPPPPPDACAGPDCEYDTPYLLPEHGELRLEQFQYAPEGAAPAPLLAAQAFFFTDQEPAFRSFTGTALPLRQELTDRGYVCMDLRAGNNFDNGKSPQAQAVADTREYIDVGAQATLTNAADASDVITLDQFLAVNDPLAATDLSSGLVHDVLYKGAPDTAVTLGARYLPAIAGSPVYPTLELGFGESATGEEMTDAQGVGTPQIYVPANFRMLSPTEADFFAAAGLTFTRGQDTIFTYTIDAPEIIGGPDGFPTILPFVRFVDNTGMVNAFCLEVTPGELDDGELIVPYEVLEIVPPVSEGGYVLFGRFTHVAWEARNLAQVSRLDLLGVINRVSPAWTIVDAAPVAASE